jgi:hypothetical protein
MIPRIISIMLVMVLCISILAMVTGCEGSSKRDKEIRATLDEKIKDWNTNGTFPVAESGWATEGVLKEWEFKYNKLTLIFDSTKAHPVDSRGVMEIIAKEWHDLYPENLKPRFTLVITAFKDAKDGTSEWGKVEVRKDGKHEVHWYATQTM